MELDIVRAWKDQTYYCTLDNAQKATLPVHPTGELPEIELAAVCGGVDGGPFGISTASDASVIHREIHVHTFATTCDVHTFSTAQTQTPGVLSFLFGTLQSCTNNS